MTKEISRIARYLAEPSPLPDIIGNELSLSNYSEKLLETFISAAIDAELLSDSVCFAQYYHLSPPPEATPFEMPIVYKAKGADRLLTAWSKFRSPGEEHISLVESTVRKLHSGHIFIVSKNEIAPCLRETTHDDGRHFIRLKNLESIGETLFSNEFLKSLDPKEVHQQFVLLTQSSVEKLFSKYIADENQARSPIVIETESEERLKDILGENYETYFSRLSSLVEQVDAVFCVPQLYGGGSDADLSASGGGCVFFVDNDIGTLTSEVIDKLQIISQKICSTGSAVYDLSRVTSQARVQDLWGSIKHSIQNACIKDINITTPNEVIRRILWLEVLTIDAGNWVLGFQRKELPKAWGESGLDSEESIGVTIAKALNHPGFNLSVLDSTIQHLIVDERLSVIVNELARNLKSSKGLAAANPEISIVKNESNDLVNVSMETRCSGDDLKKIYTRLTDPTSGGGVKWIATICSRLRHTSGSRIEWKFVPEDIHIENICVPLETVVTGCFIIAPQNVFKFGENDLFSMKFTAKDLQVVINQNETRKEAI